MKQQGKKLIIKEVKTYSRKQIIAWVSSSQLYKFEDLNNGVFFIQLLQKLVPSEINRLKIYPNANNYYESTQNMNLVKKILVSHGLQTNMDVNSIVTTKNCFQLANWFKNLYEQNQQPSKIQLKFSEKSLTPASKFNATSVSFKSPSIKNLSRATSSDLRKNNSNLQALVNLSNEFSKATQLPKPRKSYHRNQLTVPFGGQYSINSFDKQKTESLIKKKCAPRSRGKNSESKKIRLANSQFIDSEKNSSSEANLTKLDLTHLKYQTLQKISSKQLKTKNLPRVYVEPRKKQNSQTIWENNQNKQHNYLLSLMKKEALQSSIETYDKILNKIRKLVDQSSLQQKSIQQFRSQISDTIYMKIKLSES